MAGKGRGKCSRDQTSKDRSGITPPVKKSSVAIRRNDNDNDNEIFYFDIKHEYNIIKLYKI